MPRYRLILGAALVALTAGAAIGVTAVGNDRPRPPGLDSHGSTQPSDSATSPADIRRHFTGAARPIAVLPNGKRRAIDSILNVAGPMHYGEFVWNDDGVPRGRVWVRVDLDSQIMSVFRGNHEIGTAVVLYGADSKPTPIGSFPVLAKLRDHVSSIYDAPMPYTMRLTGDGIAIHGSNVRANAATHGCVGVPTGFAARMFEQVMIGDQVVIVRGGAKSTPPGASEAAAE